MAKVAANNSILKWARESANLSLEDVANKIKKPTETIRAWEAGTDYPTYVQLESLAYQIYKRPIAVFFFPEPPKEDSPAKSFRTLPESEIDKLTPNIIHLLRQARVMQINLTELCDGKNPMPQKIFEGIAVRSNTRLTHLAQIVRTYLGIELEKQQQWAGSTVAFDSWRDAIESKGIFVFKEAFREAFKKEGLSGFCLYDSEFPIIYINNSMPRTRQIFTLFHELAHLLFKTGGIAKSNDDYLNYLSGTNLRIEILCNKFTADFLVPNSDFDRRIIDMRIDEHSISTLASKYAVSPEVILRKLLERGKIAQEDYEEKAAEGREEWEKRKSRSGGGNYYFTQVAYLGRNYINLAFDKYYRNQISINQLADFLNVKESSVSGVESALKREEL